MKITIQTENYDPTHSASVTLSDGSDVYEVIESICNLLVGYGYHPNSVKDGIISKSEEYLELENDKSEEE